MDIVSTTFLADVHLGKLARLLRLLGFDTLCESSFTTAGLTSIAARQKRTLLTRNALPGNDDTINSFFIRYEEPKDQLQQVLNHFELKDEIHPFTRCLVCNAVLETVLKEAILLQLAESTSKYYNDFWQCTHCKRIYWKGSHYNRMLNLISSIKNLN